jgi:hypothetical protein
MKLQLDATPEELATKGPILIKALAERIAPHNPDLAENLDKALRKESPLKYPTLRDLHEASSDAYQRQSLEMIADIDRVLRDQETKALRKADLIPGGEGDKKKPSDFDAAAVDAGTDVEMEHTNNRAIAREIALDHLAEDPKYYEKLKAIHKADDDDPDYDPESGEPILDPKTGMSPTETKQDKIDNPENYETEDTEKSVGTLHDQAYVDVDGDDDELGPDDDDDEKDDEKDGDTGKVPVESETEVGKSLEDYPMAASSVLVKAGPHKYTRRWKDTKGNWQYEYPAVKETKAESSKGRTAVEDPGERWDDKKATEELINWGDRLYEAQAPNPDIRDGIGFNSFDTGTWQSRGVSPSLASMRRLLKKYRRQISGFASIEDYYRAGLGDSVPKETVKAAAVNAVVDLKTGDVKLPVDGRIKRSSFGEYLGIMRDLKSNNWVRWDGEVWRIPSDMVAGFPTADYERRLESIGLAFELPEVWPPPEVAEAQKRKAELKAEEKQAGLPDDPTADELIEGIKNRKVTSTIVVKRHAKSPTRGVEAGAFTFHAPYSPEFNNLFNNRSGQLSGITEYKKDMGHARLTYSLELVEEAIDKLKAVLPNWKVVIEGVREAQEERERYQAEIKKPIPEIQKVMGIDPATDKPYALFPYQNEGVRFLQARGGNALIGDEMGIGKTLQALGYAVADKKRTLTVVPKVVRRQWLDEAHKFFPGHFQTKELVKADLTKLQKNPTKVKLEYVDHLRRLGDEGNLEALRSAEHYAENLDELSLETAIEWKLNLRAKNLVSINYEAVEAYLPYLKKAGLELAVIDESDRIKNPKAQITKRLQGLAKLFSHKILMSGTAIRNKRAELFTQAEIVSPGLFSPGELKGMGSTIGGAWHKARKIMISRQKKDVLPDLPPKTTVYSRQEMKGIPDITGKLEIGDISALKSSVAVAKAPYTADLVKQMLAETDGKVIVFSDLTEAAKAIKERLGDVAVLHHGGLSDKRRSEAVSTFQDPKSGPRVFISTTGSAGVGLNLQVANRVVFNDDPWTGAAMRQAEDRAHRATSTQPVNVIHVTAAGNAWDETVSDIIQRKLVLHAKMQHGKQLTEEERAWEKTRLSFAEIIKQVQGEKAKPAVQASGSDESLDESVPTVMTAKPPKGFKIPEPPASISPPKRTPVKAKDAIPKPVQPAKREPVKPGKPGEQLALFKAQFAEIASLFGEPFAYDYMVLDKGFKDHTEAIAAKDDRLYQEARRVVSELDTTVKDADFDKKGGRFYGWSTNQLVDYVREKRK